MEVDVSIDEDEASFDPQDLLGDPARQEISQTSLEIMQLLAECEGGHELFGNIHQGNFIYDNASLVGSSSELSEIFQDDDHPSSGHRLDDILVNSIESLNKSPVKTANCQHDRTQKKRQRKSKESNKKSPKCKPRVSRRKNGDKNDADGNKKGKSRVNGTKCTTPENSETEEKMSTDKVQDGSSVIDSTSCSRVELNSKYEVGDDGTYTCKMCGKKFTSVRFLQIHSTVHRQKVKLVSRSSTDPDLLRSKKKNSPSKTKNFSKGDCVVRKGLGFPSDVKSVVRSNADSVLISSQHSPKLTELSQHCERADISKVNTSDESKGKVLHNRKSEQSVLNKLDGFDNKANRNTPCSETLKSLSKHGSKEYLTLSTKKLKTSCRNKTDRKIKSLENNKALTNGEKAAISTEQDSGSVCKDARKRKASGKSGADKCAMKRVCLLDRFWEDDEESQTGQNLGKPDSVCLKTVDPNPRTNGGLILLQSFDKDKSQEGSKSGGRTNVRIKRGQLVRSKKFKVKKSAQQKDNELKQILTGNARENIQEPETFVRENFANVTFPSKEKDKYDFVISTSNTEPAQHGSVKNGNDRTKPNIDQGSTKQLNLKSSPISSWTAENCKMKEMHTDNDTDATIKGRVGSDDNFHANFEEKIKTGTEQQDKEKMLSKENKGDNSTDKRLIQPSSSQSNITDASVSKCDSCCTDLEEVEVPFSEKSKIKDGQIFRDDNLSRDFSHNGVKCGKTEKQLSSQTNTVSGCSDNDNDDMDDISDERSSDEESEPLVLYQQSCRTLPLCALLNLARSQKLEHDLSRKSDEVEQENVTETAASPVLTEFSDKPAATESDENVHARKCKKFASLSPIIEISSKSMLKSNEEVDGRIQVIHKNHVDISVHVSSCFVTSSENGIPENLQIDRPKSTNGKEWASFPSETKTSASCTGSASSVAANSPSGSLPILLLAEPAKSTTSSQPVHLLAEQVKCTSGSEPAVLSAHTEPATSTCVIESASSCKSPKLEKSSKLSDIQLHDFVHLENTGLLTDKDKSNQPFEMATSESSVALCEVEERGGNIAEHLESVFNGNSTSPKQELGIKQNEQLPCTEDVEQPCNVSSSYIEVRQSDVHADIKKSLKLSTVSDDGISSLKSIQDEHCVEVSRCVVRRISVSGNESDEVVKIEKFGEEKEMNKENNKSDDTLDEHMDDDSVDDEIEDSSQFQNSSYFPNSTDDRSSLYLSTETKQGFQHIKVPEKLPQNVMSTCNVIGRFADDMVTGITNVIDTEPNLSNSSSGFSKFHDYCARQISYQNFLEWKLGQIEARDSSLVRGSVCARSLPFQDFQRKKCEELLSSGKYLEGITEVDISTNKPEEAELQEIGSRTQSTVVNGMAETDWKEPDVIQDDDTRINIGNIENLQDTEMENITAAKNRVQKTLEQANETVTTNFESFGVILVNNKERTNKGNNLQTHSNETRKDTESSNVLDKLDISSSHTFHERSLNEKNILSSSAIVTESSKHNNVMVAESWQSEIQDTSQVRTHCENSKRNVCSVTMSANQYESSEDEIPVNVTKVDLCARVLPFETNIMHKFSDKTKLLFQEYHKRQQNSPDVSDSDKECTEVYIPSVDHQTQTVSSMEESECSVYEIHMLRSVSPCINSNDDQNFKINSQRSETHLSFSEVTSEEGAWSTENLENAKELVSVRSKGCSESLSSNPEISSKSDIVPFKSRMNLVNFEDVSTSALNQQNIPLSEHDQQYLKSPKKLWYRNYMGGISTMGEKTGDNPQPSETTSDQTHFIFPEFDQSEQHKNADVHELSDLDTNVCEKENTQEKMLTEESNDCSQSNEFSRQSCDVIRNSEESQTSFTKIHSDTEHFSDTSIRFGTCSRMRQFRKRRSCARTCRDGYLRGCARSRAFTQKNK